MIVEATPSQFGDIVVDQKTILWNSSYCLGYPGSAQWQVGSNASLGICSPQIPVNPEKFYVIFVGCEAEIYALPDGGSSSAVAWATLNVSVPSITWQLTPRVPTVVASNRRLPLPRTR